MFVCSQEIECPLIVFISSPPNRTRFAVKFMPEEKPQQPQYMPPQYMPPPQPQPAAPAAAPGALAPSTHDHVDHAAVAAGGTHHHTN